MSKTYVSLSLALLAGLFLSPSLSAQPWEKAYGPSASEEEGHRRVTPVTQCPGRGYIAIGTANLGGFPSQVYLVRTDDSGARIWEHYFDIGFDSQADHGLALVELRDGTGFMTTGTSERGFQAVAHSLRVDCDGRPLFSHFYAPPFAPVASRVTGHDIREAVVGDNITTKAGDFIIAGYLDDGSSSASDAILLRINSSGNLVWHRRYDTGATERFYGLTEARPNVNGGGDIIAVGDWRDGGRSQALAARVNGNDGSINPLTYQCMAIYGDAGEENFQSVVEIRLAPFTGALAMAGLSTSPGQLEDVYLVETKPSPCSMIAQTTIGNELFGTYTEFATDLIEVLAPVNSGLGVPLGSLALTGYGENGAAGDAFLLFASQGTLLPITGRLYGDHRGSKDWGTSLQQLRNTLGPVVQPRGFIIAGTTTTDWDGTNDRRDLYLIQPNDKASTGCEVEWSPDGYEWRWPLRPLDPRIDKVVVEEEVRVDGFRDDTVIRICH